MKNAARVMLAVLAVTLSACTGTVMNKTRQLTCLGFCSDTGVEHTKSEATEPDNGKK